MRGGRLAVTSAPPLVSQCADMERIAVGRGSFPPSISHDAVHSFGDTALRGVPCPIKTTGILSVTGIFSACFIHATRLPNVLAPSVAIRKSLRPRISIAG